MKKPARPMHRAHRIEEKVDRLRLGVVTSHAALTTPRGLTKVDPTASRAVMRIVSLET